VEEEKGKLMAKRRGVERKRKEGRQAPI